MTRHTARYLPTLALLATLSAAEPRAHRLYVCGMESKGYVVGAKLPPSGLFLFQPPHWTQLGFNHPAINAATYDPRDPRVLYLAAGNGCIRSSDGGKHWRVLTSWQMTELQDVALDPARPQEIYVALSDGIGFSPDAGRTWSHRDAGIARKFVQTIAVDRTRAGRVFAGAEQGIFRSEDSGLHWTLAGANGSMITHLEQSPTEPGHWMATAERGGLFLSTDNGHTWSTAPGIPTDHALYNVSLHPHHANIAAVCGWHLGIRISEDGGRSWQQRSAGLPSQKIWRVAFDPAHARRLWASVHEEAAFYSDDLGTTWTRAAMDGSIIREFLFVPEARP